MQQLPIGVLIFLGILAGGLILLAIAHIIDQIIEEKGKCYEVVLRSKYITYDEMGYPLRLCLVRVHRNPDIPFQQTWIDTEEQEGDVRVEPSLVKSNILEVENPNVR